ncbi:hypothetical protein ACOME3_010248 [Neoechinorhynchus agilis]
MRSEGAVKEVTFYIATQKHELQNENFGKRLEMLYSLDMNCIDISEEDQEKISAFAQKHVRLGEIEAKIYELELLYKDQCNSISELEELELCDDVKNVWYRIGMMHIMITPDRAREIIVDRKKSTADSIANLQSTIDSLKDDMNVLKKHLYERFGGDINLEGGNESSPRYRQ